MARQFDRLEFSNLVLFQSDGNFGGIFDFHMQMSTSRRSFGCILCLTSDVLIVVLFFGRQFQDRFDVGSLAVRQHFFEDFDVVCDQVAFAIQPDNLKAKVIYLIIEVLIGADASSLEQVYLSCWFASSRLAFELYFPIFGCDQMRSLDNLRRFWRDVNCQSSITRSD